MIFKIGGVAEEEEEEEEESSLADIEAVMWVEQWAWPEEEEESGGECGGV